MKIEVNYHPYFAVDRIECSYSPSKDRYLIEAVAAFPLGGMVRYQCLMSHRHDGPYYTGLTCAKADCEHGQLLQPVLAHWLRTSGPEVMELIR